MTRLGLVNSHQAGTARSSRLRAQSRLGVILCFALLMTTLVTSGRTEHYDKAPELPSQDPQRWIGPPQSLKSLQGKVVILDVWTFG